MKKRDKTEVNGEKLEMQMPVCNVEEENYLWQNGFICSVRVMPP